MKRLFLKMISFLFYTKGTYLGSRCSGHKVYPDNRKCYGCSDCQSSFTINWLKLVNVIVLQWFFIRLTRCKSTEVIKFDPHLRVRVVQIKEWYSIQRWIVPLTGWMNPSSTFVWIGKHRTFVKLTKSKTTYRDESI